MRVAGFVSELNPFHNGHARFINRLRAAGATHIVTAMSGCFVQRGEAALTDKMLRAEAAVKSGVDLVLDLPVPWALGSAESFARGGVSLLVSFGCDLLSFGCETDDAALLKQTAVMLGSEKVREATAARMKRGCTYPAALAQTLEAMGEERALHLLETPNNVLAVEYLKALQALHTDLPVLPVRRTGASHDALLQDGAIQSASAIRALTDLSAMRPYLPQTVYDVLEKHPGRLLDRQSFETAVLTALRLLPDDAFDRFATDRSGLADRLRKSVRQACSLSQLYELAKTKSLTHAKIRREVMHLFLQINPDFEKETPPFARILAANNRGMELLARRCCNIPVITKHAETAKLDERSQSLYALQCRAGDLYALCTKEKRACCTEQQSSILII